MEESFTVRVDKAFGSLSSASQGTLHSSLWSLTDDEIEPQQDHEFEPEEKHYTFDFFDNFPSGVLQEASGSKGFNESHDFDPEEFEIKSSIGLDPTLDNEEEEDEYDTVAVGKLIAGDRLYLKDIDSNEPDAGYYNPLPSSFRDISRDPRANIIAAKVRLEEDAEAAKKLNPEIATKITSVNGPSAEDGRLKSIPWKDEESVSRSLKRVRFDTEYMIASDEDGAVKAKVSQEGSDSLLAGKENLIEVSSADGMDKVVDGLPMETCTIEEIKGNVIRGCSAEGAKDVTAETLSEGAEEIMMETYSSEVAEYIQKMTNGKSSTKDHPSQVPAYLRNPLNYTHYTFDSSTDMDEDSNRQAFMDFLSLIKKSKTTDLQPEENIFDSSKPVTFIPKRKNGGVTEEQNDTRSKGNLDAAKELARQKIIPVDMVAVMDDVCAMEEDELETDGDRKHSARRFGRQYRTKSRMGSDESQS